MKTAILAAAILVGATGGAMAGEGVGKWAGLYVGVHGGMVDSKWDGNLKYEPTPGDDQTAAVFSDSSHSLSDKGGLYGIQIGYNWQFNNIVVGVEGDAAFADTSKSNVFTSDSGLYDWDIGLKTKGVETLRLRVGYAAGPVLLFATGGLAIAHTEGSLSVMSRDGFTPAYNTAKGSAKETHVGFAVGGGAEWMIAPNWTLSAQYMLMDFGAESYRLKGTAYPDKPSCGNNPPAATCSFPHTTDSFPADLQMQTFRLGLNFKFQ
jgi:outer membrane immunogenic protein